MASKYFVLVFNYFIATVFCLRSKLLAKCLGRAFSSSLPSTVHYLPNNSILINAILL